MSASAYWALRGSEEKKPDAITARTGLVRANHKVVFDDTGIFHPLGLTFFWALYGWKFEHARIMAHLKWMATKKFDYLRILGECDWEGRSWSPQEFPDYVEVLQGFVDAAYDHGMRSEVTIVGGRPYDKNGMRRYIHSTLAMQVTSAMRGREHKVMHYECVNEWNRLDKATMNDLVNMGQVVTKISPNIASLSCPTGEREHNLRMPEDTEESSPEAMAEDKPEQFSGYEDMIAATKAAGCSGYTLHPRRSSHDHGWSHVRQGYDFKDFPGATFNNEPEGPQSSVVSMSDPLQLACTRLLGIMCGGAGYVLHVGQGVTGLSSPAYGRPENMWEVNNIDAIMEAVRGCDDLMPEGIENWKCVNNGRSDHPLQLDGTTGFWESGAHDRAPAVNKNYAAISPNGVDFRVMLTGCKSAGTVGPVPGGKPKRPCIVNAIHPVTKEVVVTQRLNPGEMLHVPGRGDTMAAYVVSGRYI